MRMTENFTQIFAALVKFQALVKNPPKRKTAQIDLKNGKSFHYKYADLADILDATREARKETGIGFIQNPIYSEDGQLKGIQTVLIHESGEAIWFDPVYIPSPAGASNQQIGSSITYARRYSLCLALGIVGDDDDDAQAADADQVTHEPQQVQKPKRQVDPERQRLLQSMAQSFEDWQNGITPEMKKQMEEEERKKKGRRKIAIACKEKGLSDEERRLIIQDLTGKTSSKELTLDELIEVYQFVSEHSAEKLQEIVKAIKYKKMDEVLFGQETA